VSAAKRFADVAMAAAGRGPYSPEEVAHAMTHDSFTTRPVAKEFADTLDGTKWRRLLAFRDVSVERNRQDDQWGGPSHDDKHSVWDWARFITKPLNRLILSMACPRDCLVKIAALAIAGIESIDRKAAEGKGGGS
jgi:hypothetical protein